MSVNFDIKCNGGFIEDGGVKVEKAKTFRGARMVNRTEGQDTGPDNSLCNEAAGMAFEMACF